jgi:hypothetical protein
MAADLGLSVACYNGVTVELAEKKRRGQGPGENRRGTGGSNSLN